MSSEAYCQIQKLMVDLIREDKTYKVGLVCDILRRTRTTAAVVLAEVVLADEAMHDKYYNSMNEVPAEQVTEYNEAHEPLWFAEEALIFACGYKPAGYTTGGVQAEDIPAVRKVLLRMGRSVDLPNRKDRALQAMDERGRAAVEGIDPRLFG